MRKFIVWILSLVLPWFALASWLVLTEVYFAGTDERLEIHNNSDQSYSGVLEISGVKNSTFYTDQLTIWAWSNILIGDSLGMVQDKSNVVQSNSSFSISDTQDLVVHILESWSVLDTISANGNTLSNLKSNKASLQKIQSWSEFLITGGSHISGRNVLPGFFASPWKVWSMEEIINNSWNIIISWNQESIPNIKITEVFFDGYDERIEFSNIWEQIFSGNLNIMWAGWLLEVTWIVLLPKESKIIAQNDSTIIDKSVIHQSGVSITIQDFEDIAISLFRSGQLLDTFQVHHYYSAQINDLKTSFEKVEQNWIFKETITTTWRIFNIISGYQANPWTFFSTFETLIDVSTWNNSTWTNQTGNYTTWNNNSWSSIICNDFQKTLIMSEVFPGDSNYPPYIEIFGVEDFSGEIELSGTIIPQSFKKNINIEKWQYVLISSSDNNRLSIMSVLLENSLELSTGELAIKTSGQSGQVLDNIKIDYFSWNKSAYPTNKTECLQKMEVNQNFSPSFDEKLLVFFSGTNTVYVEVEKVVEVEKIVYIENWEDYDCPSCECDTCPVCSWNLVYYTWNLISWNNTTWINTTGINLSWNIWSWYVFSGKIIEIQYIEFDPPWEDTNKEFIKLKSNVNYDINLDNLRIHSLNRTTKNRIYWILNANTEMIFTGNFRFPNTENNCVNLLSGDQILDQYCYQVNQETEDNNWTWVVIDTTRQQVFKIEKIDFDPEWSDTNNEKITVSLISWNETSMENFKLLVNTRSTKLFYPDLNSSANIKLWEQKTFIGNFRFPNTEETCISLILDNWIYDTLCYKPTQEIDEELELDPFENYIIKIKEIVYDPEWSDTNKEEIVLEMISGDNIDLSQLKLLVNWNKRTINWSLSKWNAQRFVGNFRFPNTKKNCVSLTSKTKTFDTFCYEPSSETEENQSWLNYENYQILLSDIIFDPEWTDKDEEKISILFQKWENSILNLWDKFYLQWWNTRRSLKNYWEIKIGDKKTLKWNFGFPNSKETCVELTREDIVFDKICYNPEIQKTELTWVDKLETLETNTQVKIKIVSIIPNPNWKDSDSEEIQLMLEEGSDIIDLTDKFFLLIWERKKYFKTGTLEIGKTEILKSNFGFPNSTSCVSLWKWDLIFDKICYEKPEEWMIFSQKWSSLNFISIQDLWILKKIKLKKNWDNLCATYLDSVITCQKYKIQSSSDYKIYKNYVEWLHNYLKQSRNILFYNTPVYHYYNLLTEAKKELSKWNETIIVRWKEISTYDLERWYNLKYDRTPFEILISHYLNLIIPKEILTKYWIIKNINF